MASGGNDTGAIAGQIDWKPTGRHYHEAVSAYAKSLGVLTVADTRACTRPANRKTTTRPIERTEKAIDLSLRGAKRRGNLAAEDLLFPECSGEFAVQSPHNGMTQRAAAAHRSGSNETYASSYRKSRPINSSNARMTFRKTGSARR